MSKRVYFIGIGGISMSSLAVFFAVKGNLVEGSDIQACENLNSLCQFGIKYNIGHFEKNIKEFNPNLVVYNSAINKDNPELTWAIKKKKKLISRAEALAHICKGFKNVVAISGTHGKTTTTALISEIMREANLHPTVHIGGVLKSCCSNFLIGNRKFFITEACEYKNSFLTLSPSLGVVLNIEPDHLDFFKNLSQIKQSFNKFLENSKVKLFKINEFEYCLKSQKFQKYYYAKNVKKNDFGFFFDFYENENLIGRIQTNFQGEHNAKNALVAAIVANFYKIRIQTIKRAIKNFKGVKRRFERITKISGSVVIHDYAHHPTEIEKVIEQAKRYGRILTVFQPHTFSRTKKLLSQFTTCFNQTNNLILLKTYPAREEEIKGATASDLFEKIMSKNKILIFKNENKSYVKNNHIYKNINYSYIKQNINKLKFSQNAHKILNSKLTKISYFETFDQAREKILDEAKNYGCVLILGAGDINELAYSLKKFRK